MSEFHEEDHIESGEIPADLAHRAAIDQKITKPLETVNLRSPISPKSPKSPGLKGSALPTSPKDVQANMFSQKLPKEESMSQPKRQSKDSEPKKAESSKAAKPSGGAAMPEKTGLPDFIIHRNQLFDELKQKYDAELREREKPEIDVVLDLGLDKEGKSRPLMHVAAKAFQSTPGSFLKHVDKEISANVVIAKIDGKELWDLDRPLERSCRVSYLPFTSAEGRNVFWHSSAHVLGEAAECQYNCLLSHGPPVEQGFFYDMALEEG